MGEGFSGWQRQPNAVTVQATLEEAIARIVGRSVRVVGAGRTDAGVHARRQVAHLELDADLEIRALIHGTNHYLPEAVRVLDAQGVQRDFHARKSALGKEYRYRLSRERVLSPLDALVMVPVPDLDVAAMRAATKAIPGRHDFTAFALAGGAHGQPFRQVFAAEWHEDGPRLELRIIGEGFLRGMVRSLVGTLLEVGQGKRSPAEFATLLAGRTRSDAGPTAPARGLVLERVLYDPKW